MAEGFDAADTTRASARAIVEEWTGELLSNAPQSRPHGGYDSLLAALSCALPADKVRLQLQTVVREVRWSRGTVEVEGDFINQPFRASAARALITLPLGVLQVPSEAPGAVKFAPPLADKRAALQGLGFGPVIKLILRFRSAFWEEIESGRYRDASFFHAPKSPLPTFWTALPLRAPIMVAWAGGPRAARLASGGGGADIVRHAIDVLQSMFGKSCDVASYLEAAYFQDWQHDPFACGAYSYVAVGGGRARQDLAAPLQDTLFFAGEATDTEGEAATVTGALQSGERAAREIADSWR
jgi:monoamine oxidase